MSPLPVSLLEVVLEFLSVEQGLEFRQVCSGTRFVAVRPGALRVAYGSALLRLLDVRRLRALELLKYDALRPRPSAQRLDCLLISCPVFMAQADELSNWLASLRLTSLRLSVRDSAVLQLRTMSGAPRVPCRGPPNCGRLRAPSQVAMPRFATHH